jgi:hypothetical protein
MAAKAAAAKAPVKASKTTAKKTGLHLTAAQWAAYDKAYSATAKAGYSKLALQAAAVNLRKMRLAAAAGAAKKAAAAKVKAVKAKSALQAARAALKQDKALQKTALIAKADALVHQALKTADSLQAKASASAHYAQDAVKRELTPKEALAAETALFAKAAKVAKAAAKTPVKAAGKAAKPAKKSAATIKADAAVAAASQAAGLAAAKKVPASAKAPAAKKAPRPDDLGPYPPRTCFWRGDPEGDDCLAAAIANSLLWEFRLHLTPWQYGQLVNVLGDEPDIGKALHTLKWYWSVSPSADLKDFELVSNADRPGLITGFCSPGGGHAALTATEGNIICWGEVLPLSDAIVPGTEIVETWKLTWVKRL